MSVLSDGTIEQLCMPMKLLHAEYHPLIEPFNIEQLQPASYDLRLQDIYGHGYQHMLQPGEFVLGGTIEQVNVPGSMVARIEGKSSLARKGIIVHTAGFIDPGFSGKLTLEITNLGSESFFLANGMLIAQLAFQFLDRPAKRPYGHPDLGSHYQNQAGAAPSVL